MMELLTNTFDRIHIGPFFAEIGTITAGNVSSLNDGACAVLRSTAEKTKELGVMPHASFSLVPIAAIKKFNLAPEKDNPHAGAVSLGHPIGMSGARIVAHFVHVLKEGQYDFATLCNGDGGASGFFLKNVIVFMFDNIFV
uniref:Thiolase C-terminal domain-containing protein n=1 Tax=Panagrolaimus sp. ES5 TaxID=591445 RepID=A0AC34G596_9BILA